MQPALDTPCDLEETRRTLAAAARRRFGAIPHEAIVEHVLTLGHGGDFAVHAAALDALIRRMGFAARDGLAVSSAPERRGVVGAYSTTRGGASKSRGGAKRRRSREPRPYTSWLESVSPPRGSCDCPDYLRSSLGLCKHLLVVLDYVHTKRGRGRPMAGAPRAENQRSVPRLVWDPRLPLAGELYRPAGLAVEHAAGGAFAARVGELVRSLRGAAAHRDAARRFDLLRDLARALREGGPRGERIGASPAAWALVDEELARAERLVRCASSLGAVTPHLRGLGRKLYPYQREGVLRFLRTGRLLLADDMGLGKTTQAIAACHALFRAGRVRRGVLIVPSSLKPQWLREWQDTTDAPASIVDGTPAERAKIYRGLDAGFLVMSYEQLLRDAARVQAIDAQIVVLDEAQRIKNYATKSAAYVKALAPEYRLVLTGTPMENRLEELASILDWIDDVALAPKWRMVPWYTEWSGQAGRTVAGARNLDTLRARLSGCTLRRQRKEVLKDLPPRTDTRVPVEMTEQQRTAHDDLAPPIAALAQRASSRPLTQPEFLRLMSLLTQQRIISNGLGQLQFEELWPTYASARFDHALLDGLFAPKLAELRRIIEDVVVRQERRAVVFSQWRRMLRLAEWSVRDILEDAGMKAVFFTGAERQAQRTRAIVDFHDDPRVRVMLLSDAGGVGLNLQKAATCCINLELPWNPAVLEQRIGRIYRLGQARRIDVYNLVSEYGIESRIATLVGAKHALFKGLFDGESDEVRFDSAPSFLTRIEQIVDLGAAPAAPSRSRGAAIPEIDVLSDVDAAPDAGAGELAADDAPIESMSSAPAVLAKTSAPALARLGAADPSAVAGLFGALRVERKRAGGIRIEAPPEAAESLAALFAGMAKLMGAVSAPP